MSMKSSELLRESLQPLGWGLKNVEFSMVHGSSRSVHPYCGTHQTRVEIGVTDGVTFQANITTNETKSMDQDGFFHCCYQCPGEKSSSGK